MLKKQYLNDRKSFIMNNQKIENWEKINLAIDYYLKLGFWRNLENANSVVKFDEQVLNKVEELYNYATAFDVDWQKDTIQNVLIRLEKTLKEKYKNLSKESIETLKRCFSYNWK